jgi:hypothetical protein
LIHRIPEPASGRAHGTEVSILFHDHGNDAFQVYIRKLSSQSSNTAL